MNQPSSRLRLVDRIDPPLALLVLAVSLYIVYFSALTILRHHAFESRALDLGNLHQAIWNTAHGNWFRMTNQEPGLTSRLSMHVEPILLLVAALYRIFPGVETLLILQATVVGLGAVPLYLLAKQQQLGTWLALLFACAYLINPTVQAANWLEFHPVTLVPTFLIAAFYCLVTRRNGWFALFAVLAATCKEEIGLLVGMMGLYAWIVLHRPRFGLITFVLSVGWSLLAVLGIQAAFAGGNIHWSRYAYLGETTTDKLIALVTRPDLILAQLQRAQVVRYFFHLLLPVSFLALLAPEVLLLALPSLAINLLADFPPMHEATVLIYAAPIVPFVMVAAVMGTARVRRWLNRRGATVEAIHRFDAAVALILVLGAIFAQGRYGFLPRSGHDMVLVVTEHNRRAQGILDQIPPLASVAAQDRLNPHVAGRPTVTIVPRIDDADYVLIDTVGPAWPQHPNDVKQMVDDLLAGPYGVAAADDGYLLLSRTAVTDTLPASFFSAWLDPATQDRQPFVSTAAPVDAPILFGDELQLDDVTVRRDRRGHVIVDMQWQALRRLSEDYRIYVAFLDAKGNVLHDTAFNQPTSVLWYPTTMWEPGKSVFVGTVPWIYPWTLPEQQFTLAIGLYTGEGTWQDGERLTVSSALDLPVQDGSLVRLGAFGRTPSGEWVGIPNVPPLLAALPATTIDAPFGDSSLRLLDAALPKTARHGDALNLHLTWQRNSTEPDYSRFVHLIDATGNKVAQVDGPVSDALGPLPISSWPVGHPIDDVVTLALPSDLAPGSYSVVAGLYDWRTEERLNADGPAATSDGAVKVGTIKVE